MNLQICVPYEKCPFNCHMCIAADRPVFKNSFINDRESYINKLINIFNSNEYEYFILTCNTDPTLNKDWLETVSGILSSKSNMVELQTRNYNLYKYNLSNIGMIAYSIISPKDYFKAWRFRKIDRGNNRLVILLTKEFDFLNTDNFDSMGFNEITFKVLQKGISLNQRLYVDNNKMESLDNIYGIIDRYNGTDVSIRIDNNCQDSHGRYKIFREDGILYNTWEDNPTEWIN